jgi:CysZ protein
MQGNFITGAGYFFKGLSMLSQRGIWPFAILPLLANIAFFLFIGSLAYSYVDSIVSVTEEALPEWLHFLAFACLAGGKGRGASNGTTSART